MAHLTPALVLIVLLLYFAMLIGVAWFTGRNVGNEYFDPTSNPSFSDLDVLAVGPVVREVSRSFDQYWNSEFAYPIMTVLGQHTVDGGQ